ncbi:hypothetical protein PRIPAC_84372 [Pristionchus pacificus]|nr:hypothetical protein PRIPAC_84372 [Pristionchus pacificus]|eukprot:PDM66493.1 hypothetical protein PRIPAC_47910 [Pristionchus pacificus]
MDDPPASPSLISFRYTWTVRVNERQLSDEESCILHVSPKIATVHDHVSFQWNLRIHGTNGKLNSDDETDIDENGEPSAPINYVAVELYFIDGPVNQVDVKAVVGILNKDANAEDAHKAIVEERKSLKMIRGRGCELTDTDRADVSDYIMNNVGKLIHLSVLIKMDAKLFDPFTYLNTVLPTPMQSFLTANYNARVNSKVWKRRSRKFRQVMEQEERMGNLDKLRPNMADVRDCRRGSVDRRGSIDTLKDHCEMAPDHEHLFKKLLIACCDGCERRRASISDRLEEDDGEDGDNDDSDDEPESFECTEQDKEHVHDMLANMYFEKICLPQMEYVEDFIDLLIDAELNDLPVLKRACERYLCGELNTKKDLLTSLLLDLLFISIVFNLNVMKSMTLSELSTPNRMEEIKRPDVLMEDEEFKKLDKRIRSLSDRNLIELIEQCATFADQRSRVQIDN